MSFEIVRQLRDGLAYRGALEPMLVAPALETDPTLTDMATATLEFSKWRSEFDNVRSALPEGVAATVTFALDEFSADLESRQGTYLDAIRNDDRAGAETALQSLESDLGLDPGADDDHDERPRRTGRLRVGENPGARRPLLG